MASENMASISISTGHWTLEWAAEIFTKQTRISKDYEYELFLSI